jgi:hypothetical protein
VCCRTTAIEVAFCDGPEHLPGGCRLVEHRNCPLVESADVILNSLNLDAPDNRAVLTALHTSYPRTPVIALVSHREGREHPSCLHGCTVEHFPTTIHDLLGLLPEGQARRPPPGAWASIKNPSDIGAEQNHLCPVRTWTSSPAGRATVLLARTSEAPCFSVMAMPQMAPTFSSAGRSVRS